MFPTKTKPVYSYQFVDKMSASLTTFEMATELLRETMQDAEAAGAITLARAFVAARGVKDRLDEAEKAFSAIYNEVKEVRLPALFDAQGVPTVNLDEGYRVTVSQKVRASIKSGMKDGAIAWLKENKLADLVAESVNSSTLSAAAKSMAEDNLELNPDYFNVAVIPTTSVTKTNRS